MAFSKEEYINNYKNKYGEIPSKLLLTAAECAYNAYEDGFKDGIRMCENKCLSEVL